MSQIDFDIDKTTNIKRKEIQSGISFFIQKHSFGLFKDKRTTEVFLLIFSSSLIVIAFLNYFSRDAVELRQPSEELIHSPQPVKPLK